MFRSLAILFAIALGLVASFAAGWYVNRQWPQILARPVETTPVLNSGAARITRIVAQGRLRPRGGILNVMATPGQRVSAVLVTEQQQVHAGETVLLGLESEKVLQLQSRLAVARKQEAGLQLAQARLNADATVRTAEATLQSAEMKLQQLESSTELKILRRELEQATSRLNDFRDLSRDPLTRTLVSQVELKQQQDQLENSQLRLDEAATQRELALAAARTSVEQARGSLQQAQRLAELTTEAENENRSAGLASEIADLQLEQNRVVAPITGEVLRVLVQPGETVTTLPVMQLGDLSAMECVAEVSELFAGELKPGLAVVIRSPSLPDDLKGTVTTVGRIVGTATLPEPNPLALVDRKTVEIEIAIAAGDTAAARDFSNLQVTVEIQTREPTETNPAPGPG